MYFLGNDRYEEIGEVGIREGDLSFIGKKLVFWDI